MQRFGRSNSRQCDITHFFSILSFVVFRLHPNLVHYHGTATDNDNTNSCPISSKHDPVIETCSKLSNPFYSAPTPVWCLASAQETRALRVVSMVNNFFKRGCHSCKPRISEQTLCSRRRNIHTAQSVMICFCKGRCSAGEGSSQLVFCHVETPLDFLTCSIVGALEKAQA